jgi:hypothetical protein
MEYMKRITGLDVPITFIENEKIDQCKSYPWKEIPIVEINPKKLLMMEPNERCAIILHEIAECYSQNKNFYNKYPVFAQLIWDKKEERAIIAHYFGEIIENEFRKENSMRKCKYFKIPKNIRKSLEEVLNEIKEKRNHPQDNEFQIFLFR